MRLLILCVIAFASAGCVVDRDRPTEVDLLSLLPTAERRPSGNVSEDTGALVLRAPARVTWSVFLPFHAQLTSSMLLMPGLAGASQGVTLRIALSDQRRFTELTRVEMTGARAPLMLDLRDYSEWKFSLFDQPLRKRWQLIINADATPGGTVALARPRLTKS